MNKIIISLIVVITTLTSLAQAQVNNDVIAPNNNDQHGQKYEAVKYQLFPTQNMWTFIKLNSRNGEMWQVQFDINGSNRFESYLNLFPLVDKEKEANGRFNLYATQNIWTFILLDQIDGKIWQVQWSIEPEKRSILPIN